MRESELRVAVALSGGGTTFWEMQERIKRGLLRRVRIVCVIASNGSCDGLLKAFGLNIPAYVLNRRMYGGNADVFGDQILALCRNHGADLWSQNGWTVKTPANVVAAFQGMSMNQHPAPLDPDHKRDNTDNHHPGGGGMRGRAAHATVISYARRTGMLKATEATVHRVTNNFDGGAIIGRHGMLIEPKDTAETLAARLLPHEYDIVAATWQAFADGTIEEWHRQVPLVPNFYLNHMYEAKQEGMRQFPNG